MLTPVAKRILIVAVEEKHGTLLLTGQKPKKYQVIRIGDEVTKVKPSDLVYLEKHYGVEVEHENEKFLVIDEASILAKVPAND
jgi:co-chaperonin GroES (HSP10)